jgi:hypothetical protein
MFHSAVKVAAKSQELGKNENYYFQVYLFEFLTFVTYPLIHPYPQAD